mmetsp:Transcript_47267/g.150527  ORF Transcript_47267/g.150527 Transcript_47267/m.150527 type:complete len:326 (+) Transcript_47267:188-1165(+)
MCEDGLADPPKLAARAAGLPGGPPGLARGAGHAGPLSLGQPISERVAGWQARGRLRRWRLWGQWPQWWRPRRWRFRGWVWRHFGRRLGRRLGWRIPRKHPLCRCGGGDTGVAPNPAHGRGALSARHAAPPPRSHSDVWREAAARASPPSSRLGLGLPHDPQAFAGAECAGHPSYLSRVSEILADRPRPQPARPQDTMHTSTNPFSPPAAAASRAPRRLPEPAQASASFPLLRRVQPAFAHPGQAPVVPPKHFLGPLSLLAAPAPGHGSGHVAAESAQLRSRLQHLAGPSLREQVSSPSAYVGWGGGWASGPLSADMPHLVRGEAF